jgi:hypothetical protein
MKIPAQAKHIAVGLATLAIWELFGRSLVSNLKSGGGS